MNDLATVLPTPQTRDILDKLEELREELGISKSELAEKLGVNLPSLRATLNNRGGEPSIARIRSIAEALGYDIEIRIKKK